MGATKYFCACLEGAYTIGKTIYTLRDRAPVLCMETARAWSNTFCACLEGAYTIDKTTDTLHNRAYYFYA